jgi:hypothetical protein
LSFLEGLYLGEILPRKYPAMTMTTIVIERATRIVKAVTTRFELPLSLYMKYKPLNKLTSTNINNTPIRIFIVFRFSGRESIAR